MYDCANSQTKICKAYISDCYGNISKAYNGCNVSERPMLKRNIYDMLDRVKQLIDGSGALAKSEISDTLTGEEESSVAREIDNGDVPAEKAD